MDFFEVVQARRAVRKFTKKPVPPEVIEKALDAAMLAPNSSNMQTWQFYWIQSPDKRAKLVEACMSQAAARGAQELIVCVANPLLWKKVNPEIVAFARGVNAHPIITGYYEKFIPMIYGMWGLRWIIGPAYKLGRHILGWFRPVERGPTSFRDLQNVSVKSLAMAGENFLLAIVAQGFAGCPMEGIDSVRVKKLLGLGRESRIGMVIAVGEADPTRGTWGPRFRCDRRWFVQRI